MKKDKNKRKILKIRPFNMANFSGGSGYLVFSLIYQAFAILPAMIIIWLVSLVKKTYNEWEEIDESKATKRFYYIAVPICIILLIIGTVFAFETNYGTFAEYWFEVIFISIVPTLATFLNLKFFHKIVLKGTNGFVALVFSIITEIILLITIFMTACFIDIIMTGI